MEPLKNRKVMQTIKENFSMLRISINLPPQLYVILNVWLPESFDLVESIRTSNVLSFADARGIERNELYVILNFWLPDSFHGVESIKDESTRDAQAIKLLLYLMKGRINDEYIIFCNALIDVGQIGAVEKVLKDCLHLIALGPILNLKVQQTIVSNFIQLRGNINLPPKLYDILQDWLPDSFNAVESIKNESARNVQAIKLLYLMMRQTNDEFIIFCKALIYVGQIDAVENVLRECLHLIALGPILNLKVQQTIVSNFIQLRGNIYLPLELYDILQDWLPDSFNAVESIKNESARNVQAIKLLYLMMRQTNDEFVIFCKALIDVGQIDAVEKVLKDCLHLIALGPVLDQEVKEAIVGYFIQLAFHIKLPPELYGILQNRLRDSFHAVECIKYKTTKLGKATKLLHLMMQQTNDEFIISCKTLICVGQIGSVEKFLRECLDFIGKSYEGLDEDVDPPQGYDAEKMPLDDDHNTVQVKKCTKKFYEEKREQAYSMDTKRKGAALVINVQRVEGYDERTGTDIDRDKIVSLMEQLDFEPITIYNDEDGLSHEEFLHKVKAFAMTVHKEARRVTVFILSHGVSGGVCATDGKIVLVEELVAAFNHERLAGIPKMLVVQACRGDLMQDTPSTANLIICYATKDGYVSWRNKEKGSWFIAALVKVFAEHAHEFEIEELMDEVKTEVGKMIWHGKTQTPETVHNLTKDWFLFPGFPDY